jgi:hypothetical protein
MPNVFAQMDGVATPASASAPANSNTPSGNVFQQMDDVENPPDTSNSWSSLGQNFLAGVAKIPGSFVNMIANSNPDAMPFQTRDAENAGRATSNRVLKATGLDKVRANTFLEKTAQGLGTVLPQTLIPGEGEISVANMLRNMMTGAAVVTGATGAQELAPDALKPAAALAGGLATAAITHTAPKLIGRAAGAVADAAAPVVAPIAARFSQGAAEAQAGALLAKRASDVGTVRDMLAQGPQEIVPGSQPTTFQQTGDEGLGSLEREVATKNPDLFAQRRGEQNEARVQSLSQVQQGGDPNALAGALNGQWRDLEAQTNQHVDNLLTKAQGAAANTGGNLTADEYGEQVRGAVQTAEDAARAREKGLWTAVDPHGDLTGNVTQTRGAANDIAEDIPKTAKPMSGEEGAIFDAAKAMPDLAPVQDLIALRSRVSTEMRNELITNGRSPSYARLTQLRSAIQDNLNNTISERIANEAPAVARGEISPANSTLAKLQEWQNEFYATRDATGDVGGASARAPAGKGTAKATGTDGTVVPAAGRSIGAAGIEGLSGDVGPLRDIRPPKEDLSNVVDANFTNGKVVGNETVPTESLVGGTSEGDNPARVSKIAEQMKSPKGYFERIIADQDGNVIEGQHRLAAAQQLGLRSVPIVRVRDLEAGLPKSEMTAAISAAGLKNSTQINQLIGRVGEAYAEMGSVAGVRREFEPPRGFEKPWEAALDEIAKTEKQPSYISPTFDAAGAERLAAATAATRDRARTFGQNPVGPVLAKAGASDLYKLQEARVPQRFFHPGPTGFNDMQALYRSVGQDRAVPIIQDYAASSLRRAAMRDDGTLDPRKYAAWKASHADALRALPDDIQKTFATAADASRAVTDATRLREITLKDAQKGAIGRIMGATNSDDVTRIVGGLFSGKTAVADMRELARVASKDPLAMEGLRQAVADHIAKRFISNTEAGTSGTNLIKADAFQSFVKQNRIALNAVFKPEEVANIEAIAADINRAKRSENAIKLPGGSNTAQDITGVRTHDQQSSPATRRFIDILGAGIGAHFGGPVGTFLGGFGADAIQSLRAAGVDRVDQLVTKAMLNPSVAKQLLSKAPTKATPKAGNGLARAIRATTASAALMASP